MGWVIADLDVQHGGEAAEALGANAQPVDRIHDFQAQLLGAVGRAAFAQFMNVDRVHQGLLRHQCRLFCGAADSNAQHTRRAPASTHGRHGLDHPVHNAVGGVEHGQLGFVFRATALGRHLHIHGVARHHLHMDHGGGVVLGIAPRTGGIFEDGGAQYVIRVRVGAAHTFIDHIRYRQGGIPAHVHANFQEHGHNTGVLADGPVALGAHTGINQDLRHRILGGGVLLHLPGAVHGLYEVQRVIVGNELQGVGDAVDKIILTDNGHGRSPCCLSRE